MAALLRGLNHRQHCDPMGIGGKMILARGGLCSQLVQDTQPGGSQSVLVTCLVLQRPQAMAADLG